MKPAREGAADSPFFRKPRVSISPRTDCPSERTRRNSESRVNRRDFGKRKRFTIARILIRALWIVSCRASASLAEFKGWQPKWLPLQIPAASRTSKSLPRIASGKTSQNSAVDYGVADAAGEGTLIVVFVSVFSVVAGDGFTTVVLVSFFS